MNTKQVFILATFAWWSVDDASAYCVMCGVPAIKTPMQRLARVTVYDVDPQRLTQRPDEAVEVWTDRCWDTCSMRQAAGDFDMGIRRDYCIECATEFLVAMMRGVDPAILHIHPLLASFLPGLSASVVAIIAERAANGRHVPLASLESGPLDLARTLRRVRAAVDAEDLAPSSPPAMYFLMDRTEETRR